MLEPDQTLWAFDGLSTANKPRNAVDGTKCNWSNDLIHWRCHTLCCRGPTASRRDVDGSGRGRSLAPIAAVETARWNDTIFVVDVKQHTNTTWLAHHVIHVTQVVVGTARPVRVFLVSDTCGFVVSGTGSCQNDVNGR